MVSVRGRVKITLAATCLILFSYIYITIIDVKYSPSMKRKKEKNFESINKFHPLTQGKKINTNSATAGDQLLSQEPLLTLFTTWPESREKSKVWKTTLKNWAYYKPSVRPIFFDTSGRQKDHIVKQGWNVLRVSKTSSSDLPVLKNMFLNVMGRFNSSFYGYSNGDIIFDEGLIHTLHSVSRSRLIPKQPVLIIGTRTNVANLTELETGDVKILPRVAKNRGELFMSMAQDYFITDRSYPWEDIPDLVIGRRAYDNWLVMNARRLNHTVIDVTKTVTAIHQTTKSGNFEGWNAPDRDFNINLLRKLNKSVRFYCGDIKYATWMTVLTKTMDITVKKTTMVNDTCYP